jgi:hypothetical protein
MSDPFEFVLSELEAAPPRPTLLQTTRGINYIVLTCFVENRQQFSLPWSYLWWKNNEHIATIFMSDGYEFFRWSEHEGNYTCEMEAGGARSTRSNTFVFDLSAPPPAIPTRPILSNSTNGTEVILTCHVEHRSSYNRPWYYVWLKNDDQFFVNQGLERYFLSMTFQDEGNYSCILSAGGARSPKSNTFVFALEPAIPPRPSVVNSTNGTHLILTCHVEDRSAYKGPWGYLWWKNDQPINTTMIFNDDRYALSMTSHNEGYYGCTMNAGALRSPRSYNFEFVIPASDIGNG